MDRSRFPRAIGGFSLIEVMVTLLTSLIVIGSVFELFGVAQDVRRREQEVAEMMPIHERRYRVSTEIWSRQVTEPRPQ